MERFRDRAAVVTGGAQGIGRAIVDRLVAEGARVLVVDVREDGLAGVGAAHGERVEVLAADLSEPDRARAVVPEAIARFDRVHVLVNCAGVMPATPVLDVSQEEFDLTFAVNARAPLFTMQAACRHFAEHGGGAIVNVASANAFKNESPEAPYNASKAALVALTKAVAHEMGHLGIRANCVAPGETITPEGEAELERDPKEHRAVRDYLWRIPIRRAGRAEEQAAAVAFLASDDASFISGQTLIVDGGELGGGDWLDRSMAPPLPPEDRPLNR